MIIIAGYLMVHPSDRDQYLRDCAPVVQAARASEGNIDFQLSADLIDSGRINVFEQWESVQAVELFRGSGPSSEQQATIVEASVTQHEIATSTTLA